jgi:hypothetical protein
LICIGAKEDLVIRRDAEGQGVIYQLIQQLNELFNVDVNYPSAG